MANAANVLLTTEEVEWITPPISLAHPLDDGTAVGVAPSLAETAEGLERDAGRWRPSVRPAGPPACDVDKSGIPDLSFLFSFRILLWILLWILHW
ncbi:MAG: hypothetical protein K6T85_18890, partial [Gorillibacterium sp.]|nr:hypothetical protein [Gorillibacterium sp.]